MASPNSQIGTSESQQCYTAEDESIHLSALVVEVEDQEFRVRQDIFSDSKSNVFRLALENARPLPEQPLRLEGANKVDFQNLLRYAEASRYPWVVNPLEATLSSAAYRSVLKLSTQWHLTQIRTNAIREYPPMDIVERIVLAREFCVTEWLVPALEAYARLIRQISTKDIQQLGTEYILKIVQIRETMLQDYGEPACKLRLTKVKTTTEIGTRRYHNFTPDLQSLFASELRELTYEDVQKFEPTSDLYYLVDLYILVEGRLFKSFRQYFEASPVFQNMFSLPVPSNKQPDGSSKSQPLQLRGITEDEFAPFLKLMNARTPEEASFPLSEWIFILKLSTMWDFTAMRHHAIREIGKNSMTLAKKIHIARSHHVQEWLLPTLTAYTRQEQPITAEDVELLGWDYILKIIRIRESKGRLLPHSCRLCHKIHLASLDSAITARPSYDFTASIADIFRDEIARVSLGQESNCVPH